MAEDLPRLIDERAALRHNPSHRRNVARALTKSVRRSLKENSRRRSEKAVAEIEA